MHSAKRTKIVTGVTSLRLTPAEEAKVNAAAYARGLTKSQWLRRVVLREVETPGETRLLLAEILALRAVVLSLQTDYMRGAKITDARIAETLAQADARKYAMVESRINAMQNESQI